MAALVGAGAVAPASAEIGTSLSIWSNDLFRGRSLTGGRPVATVDLSYDDTGGAFLGASATAVATAHEGVRLLALQGNIGYAHRISPRSAINFGITGAHYTEYYSGGRRADDLEIYAGLVTPHFSTQIHYSPHYFAPGVAAVYGNFEGALPIGENWRLTGHVGLLRRVAETGIDDTAADWRIGVARRIGPVDLQLNWSSGSVRTGYEARKRRAGSIAIGISCLL
jgi:uncharacterized protein (TIGR02001 family)